MKAMQWWNQQTRTRKERILPILKKRNTSILNPEILFNSLSEYQKQIVELYMKAESGIFNDIFNRMAIYSDHKNLLETSRMLEEARSDGSIDEMDYWKIYIKLSPKLSRAFKETEQGKKVNALLSLKPNQLLHIGKVQE
jgi:hypothetical protein